MIDCYAVDAEVFRRKSLGDHMIDIESKYLFYYHIIYLMCRHLDLVFDNEGENIKWLKIGPQQLSCCRELRYCNFLVIGD